MPKKAIINPEQEGQTSTIKGELAAMMKELKAEFNILKKEVLSTFRVEFKTLIEEFGTFKKDFKLLKQEVEDLKRYLNFHEEEAKETKLMVEDAKDKLSRMETVEEELAMLKITALTLKNEINDRDQMNRLNNVEVRNIPQSRNENLTTIIMELSKAIGCNINVTDIDFHSRIAVNKPNQDKIKPIVLKFHKKITKDSFLSAYKKCRVLTTTDLKLPGQPHKIFASDHLTPINKKLFADTRIKAKETGYKFVWLSNCKILVRRNESSPIFRISREMDLSKLTRGPV